VLAHWDPHGKVGRSSRELLHGLSAAGYQTIVVSAAPSDADLTWPDGRPGGVVVLRRPNLGYDFGSWATALGRFPEIRTVPAVLLVNDSLVGPFAPIDHLLDRFHRTRADVWAMTDTLQLGHHLQSYVLGFRGGCLERPALRRFWDRIRVEPSRDEVIRHSELGLSRLLRRERLTTEVAIEGWRVVDGDDNPTIIGWRRLLDLGFPFVKRQLLREPDICPDGASVRGELRRRFGVDVDEW
jgi:lipopolysaccharide biosynthesis protein